MLGDLSKSSLIRRLGATAAACCVAVGVAAAPAGAQPALGEIIEAGTAEVVPDSYLVVFKDAVEASQTDAKAKQLSADVGAQTGEVMRHGLRGFEAKMPEVKARRLAADPSVAYVIQNGIHRMAEPDGQRIAASGSQSPTPSWGLDRIDQRDRPMDNRYTYPTKASSVTAYVLDSGIRISHEDFGGRAVYGIDAVDGGQPNDFHGHGTHVAATIGGTTYGVAKNIRLVAVRVLDFFLTGSTADIVEGVNWVTFNHQPGQMAVANMSLSGEGNVAIDDAVRTSIADGVTYVLSAGNNNLSACRYSPARVTEAITVGSTSSLDARAPDSNVGSCVDLFAPGVDIRSAGIRSDTDITDKSGTSQAAPHVTGAAAIALARHPFSSPADIENILVGDATNNRISGLNSGTPNKLLFVENLLPAAAGVSPPALAVPQRAAGSSSVLISFADTAFNEDAFQVWRANGGGLITEIATTNRRGTGSYSFTDSSPVQGARQCYVVVAYDNAGNAPGVSEALCVGD